MQVTVQYMAQIKRAAGCASESVSVSDRADLRDLLQSLGSRHASLRSLLLDEEGKPVKSLLFFVGEEHAGPEQRLQDGDVVTILAPMAGG